jgi:predicted glycogen debranching enzyme
VSVAREWLEADGLGGFASGTVEGPRTRRYHAVLLAATTPPTERMALVNGFDATLETPAGRFALTSQRYLPGVTSPDGGRRIEAFESEPWPRWIYRLEDGTRVAHELFVAYGLPTTALAWRLIDPRPGVFLEVRPFLSGRDSHALHHENDAFRFTAERARGLLAWRPYPDVPGILSLSNAAYRHAPEWYRRFLYEEERERGLDDVEDLASPGVMRFDLAEGVACWIVAAETAETRALLDGAIARAAFERVRAAELVRRQYASRLHRAADAYVVRRGAGRTIIAGYPWFTDWGRDTFVALRGLCLAGGRPAEARAILLEWAGALSEGMLPNHFAEQGGAPAFDSVDASLWFVVAVRELLELPESAGLRIAARDRARLERATDAILEGYAAGTRYRIGMAADGLLASGVPGVPLTWMDAKVGDWVVTPRVGKPVEVQALWLNALAAGAARAPRWREALERGLRAFRERFWNEDRGALYDVVDVDHEPGRNDPTLRPNQIFAVGGLPLAVLEGERARRVVDTVERELWTPLGPRSLAPGEPGYTSFYRGGVRERDAAYHQGTVWPWLTGPFVEAWVRVRGGGPEAKAEARARFLTPLLRHLDEAGLGHLSEIADAEPDPATGRHTPRGCPFQAWSVGELLRLDRQVLAASEAVPTH